MRHLITGGSGFVGSYMCDTLVARGERPIVFDLVAPPARHADKVDFVQGDILTADLEALLAEDVVVHHLAARQFNGPVPKKRADRTAWFDAVNVAGTERLLDAMVAKGARKLVFFSTDMTYGVPDESPVPVTHPQRPIGPYGGSKVKAEAAIGRRAGAGTIDASVFRPRLIAGAGRLGILAKLFKLIDKGLPVPLIGSGRNRYQMIAVTDCVSAALRAAELGCPGGFFNLGSEDPPEVRALLGEVIARAGSKSRLVPTPAAMVQAVLDLLDRAGATLLYPEQFAIADVDYLLDTSRTRATFDWRPARRDSDILFEAFADFKATS